MNMAVGGMEDAAAREDAPSARFAGQVVLDLVDLPERHFEMTRL